VLLTSIPGFCGSWYYPSLCSFVSSPDCKGHLQIVITMPLFLSLSISFSLFNLLLWNSWVNSLVTKLIGVFIWWSSANFLVFFVFFTKISTLIVLHVQGRFILMNFFFNWWQKRYSKACISLSPLGLKNLFSLDRWLVYTGLDYIDI
jgi:hypothetical protein